MDPPFLQTEKAQYVFMYKSPSCPFNKLLSTFNDLSVEIDLHQPLVILGDMNLDANDVASFEKISLLEETVGSKQIVKECTTNNGTCIDLVFTNLPEDNIHVSTIENTWSDHKILFVYYKL